MVFVLPFDLEYWLINVLAGNAAIFIALGLIVIAGLAAYFKMPNSVFLMSIFLFTLLMGQYAVEFYFVSLIMGIFFVFWTLARYFTR